VTSIRYCATIFDDKKYINDPVSFSTEKYEKRANPKGHWTIDRILEESRKFDTRKGFRMRSLNAYEAAKRLCFNDEACTHMSPAGKQTK